MNGIDSKEERRSHIKALVDEARDIESALKQALTRLEEVSEDKLVEKARRTVRVQRLQERLATTKERIGQFAGGARTPRQGAETRTGGASAPDPAPTPEITPEPPSTPAPEKAPQNTGSAGQRRK